jgi:hypothetical protein
VRAFAAFAVVGRSASGSTGNADPSAVISSPVLAGNCPLRRVADRTGARSQHGSHQANNNGIGRAEHYGSANQLFLYFGD